MPKNNLEIKQNDSKYSTKRRFLFTCNMFESGSGEVERVEGGGLFEYAPIRTSEKENETTTCDDFIF